jgi:L-histidine N-alpha-methyltransferase
MSGISVEVHLDPADRAAMLIEDVRVGLTAPQKCLPPVWFYDERGSRLFEEITRLPEYYLTRTEQALLDEHATEIAKLADADTLVEIGSGTSEKTLTLLEAMRAQGRLSLFCPLDVSEEVLREAAERIHRKFGIGVHGVVGDFHRHLRYVPSGGRRLLAFLGSTIGNLDDTERCEFFQQIAAVLAPGDSFLLGADLVKDRGRLLSAYDDALGVTAAFNRNVLAVLDAELDATFVPERFDHVAVWDERHHRIEMRLRATDAHTVSVRAIDLAVPFARGEDILTEISTKFLPHELEDELVDAGLSPSASYVDAGEDYLLLLATREATAPYGS